MNLFRKTIFLITGTVTGVAGVLAYNPPHIQARWQAATRCQLDRHLLKVQLRAQLRLLLINRVSNRRNNQLLLNKLLLNLSLSRPRQRRRQRQLKQILRAPLPQPKHKHKHRHTHRQVLIAKPHHRLRRPYKHLERVEPLKGMSLERITDQYKFKSLLIMARSLMYKRSPIPMAMVAPNTSLQ